MHKSYAPKLYAYLQNLTDSNRRLISIPFIPSNRQWHDECEGAPLFSLRFSSRDSLECACSSLFERRDLQASSSPRTCDAVRLKNHREKRREWAEGIPREYLVLDDNLGDPSNSADFGSMRLLFLNSTVLSPTEEEFS
ncbi:hypothetical protein Agabi119p4_2806 [Agaricus bisporus var. burnettii]|uniref:Uncharacterized protein n=1 Tax=Agaricus bisporus var. burnettii TaxID=192524 RepID=A0A8H7KIQ4_AGABI|nr:hypothetical protein Agabi119p4_2806 [Agaricus bisporus var. burnettii]